jgi:hypothetical protein
MVRKVIIFIVVFMVIGFLFTKLEGCGKKKEQKTETKEEQPVMPCMCSEQNLVFHHAVSDVRLSKNEKHTWERPHGYEVKWCAYGGKTGSEKVQQLTRNNQPEMTLQALEDNVLVMVRYYVKKH